MAAEVEDLQEKHQEHPATSTREKRHSKKSSSFSIQCTRHTIILVLIKHKGLCMLIDAGGLFVALGATGGDLCS